MVQVWQRIHSVERTLSLFFKYSWILISIGHARLQALHSLHFSLSPSILYSANLELILRMAVIGQRYLQKALLSFKVNARIIPEAKYSMFPVMSHNNSVLLACSGLYP